MLVTLCYTHSPVLAAGFLSVLGPEQDIRALTNSGSLTEVLQQIHELAPAVVMIDAGHDFDCGILMEFRRTCPNTNFVLWAQGISIELAHNAKAVGVRGILRKDLPNELLVRCIRKVAEGELWFERTLISSLLQVKEVRLSPRERQLLRLVSQGLSNKQVAANLAIAEGTVKVYFSKLFRKVNVNDRFELALYGLRNLGPASSTETQAESAETALPHSVLVRDAARRS